MTRRSLCLVVIALAFVPGAHAQTASKPEPPILRSVALAEEEGRNHPRGPIIDSVRAATLMQNGTIGSGDRSCAAVPRGAFPDNEERAHAAGSASVRIRTGDFTIGGMIGRMMAEKEAKVFWIPLHTAMRGRGLLIRAALLSPDALPADTLRLTLTNIAGVTNNFFNSGFTLPKAGSWLVVATTGLDWGCMLVPVG